jgi:hypothetical protein
MVVIGVVLGLLPSSPLIRLRLEDLTMATFASSIPLVFQAIETGGIRPSRHEGIR